MKNTHLAALTQQLPDQKIITHPDDMEPFCVDQRGRYRAQTWAVIQPDSVAAVQTVLRYCHQHHIAVTPQGGNTGLCGGATPHACLKGDGIILSLARLNQIRNLSLADNTITVDAGIILAQVQQAALAANRFFPLSLASEGSCQIGGNIACNAGGLNVVRYGTMRDLVLGLEVVLADGTLISQLTPWHKNTTGLELKHLFIGSEGILGMITAATLKLFAPPQATSTAWVGVANIDKAVALLATIKNHFAERLSSFELISNHALQLSCQYSGLSAPTQSAWHILIELTDSLADTNLNEPLAYLLHTQQHNNAVLAQSEQERQNLWTIRENISAAQRQIGTSIKHDIALPIEAVADFIPACAQAITAVFSDANIIVFGHLGDGSLHYNVFLASVSDQHIYQHEHTINSIVYEQTLHFNGTIAAEHGIGQLKNHWLPHIRSSTEINWMRTNKHSLDPHHIMNPGKVLPPPQSHEPNQTPN